MESVEYSVLGRPPSRLELLYELEYDSTFFEEAEVDFPPRLKVEKHKEYVRINHLLNSQKKVISVR